MGQITWASPAPYLPGARPPRRPTEPSSPGLRLANLKEGETVTQPPGGDPPPPQGPAPSGLSFQSLASHQHPNPIPNISPAAPSLSISFPHCLLLSPHPQVCRRLNSIPLPGFRFHSPGPPLHPGVPRKPRLDFLKFQPSIPHRIFPFLTVSSHSQLQLHI